MVVVREGTVSAKTFTDAERYEGRRHVFSNLLRTHSLRSVKEVSLYARSDSE